MLSREPAGRSLPTLITLLVVGVLRGVAAARAAAADRVYWLENGFQVTGWVGVGKSS